MSKHSSQERDYNPLRILYCIKILLYCRAEITTSVSFCTFNEAITHLSSP